MKLRSKLTILYTFITAAILFIFACIIYFSSKQAREKEFYSVLEKEAITKAKLFINAKIDNETLQEIYHNNRKIIDEVEVAIYDTSFLLLYHDDIQLDFVKESKEMINEILEKGEIKFYQGKWQIVGLKIKEADTYYIVTAAALDQYGYNKSEKLLQTCILVFCTSILFIYISGLFFSKRVLQPVREITEKVQQISATNLYLRLKTNEVKDELSELGNTFNLMLDRLENSFEAQKNFVSNISHELRTPLAAIITELELSISRERSVEEYKDAIQNSLNDAHKLASLSSNLLDLAKASYDPSEIAMRVLRVDEILMDAALEIQKKNAGYKATIFFKHEFENENVVSVTGNEYLLKTAFVNLLENGCKFSSDHECTVSVDFDSRSLILIFTDSGIGIPEEDLQNIFTPFYRGENKKYAEGYGIGLSLTSKITTLHQGSIYVNSVQGKGTSFTVLIPHLN